MSKKLLGALAAGGSITLLILLAPAAVLTAGCGEGGGGGSSGTCASDSACATGQICHPVAKVCVKTCTSASDCPDSAKTCDTVLGGGSTGDGGTSGTKVCRCSTSALCNGGNAGGSLVCNDAIRVCEVKCSSDSDCTSGRKCDTASGECKAGTATCTPACTAGQVCSNGTCVTSCKVGGCGTQVCNTTSGVCEAPKTCSTGNPQPDTCNHGQSCSGTSCKDVSTASCANITAHGAAWDPSKPGAVIYDVSKVSFGTDAAFCGGAAPVRAKVHVLAYGKTGGTALPANETALLTALHYVKSDGTEGNLATSVQAYTLSNSNKNVAFDVNFCLPTGTTSFTGAFHFIEGNETCFSVQ